MESLKHECGIAMMRLLKPLSYFREKYGTEKYALNKMYLMMEKQHNRGQEGAGLACVKLDVPAGQEYMFRERAEGKDAITKIFDTIKGEVDEFVGELYMGHLRYSTTGKAGLKYVHPFLRRNNWKAKNLCLCGNFNMTNIAEVFDHLTAQGQCPRVYSDTYIMLEYLGHRLDREVERNFVEAQEKGLEGLDITRYIDSHVNMSNVLSTSMPLFDGGYVVCGVTGSGEFFTMRDPHGIRPAFYYANDEFVVVASERPVLQTTFDLESDDIIELLPGQSLQVNAAGQLRLQQIIAPKQYLPCCFERIYFSRGNDRDIYQERKALGKMLMPSILKAINYDVEHTVFSFIPNTAEVAYYGMLEGFRLQFPHVRSEKVVSKDIKLRTFITEGDARNDLAAHVYDVTYGCLEPGVDNLVVIDDSIVRGTTLRESIIKILDRLHPKKLVIVSSAPQIRYPDFYGIDMSTMGEFIAFQACKALLKERDMHQLFYDTQEECKRLLATPESWQDEQMPENPVRNLYDQFTVQQLNEKMAELLRPADVTMDIELVFQQLDGLHQAIPNHPGDWYFSGHYPTPGGLRMMMQSFIETSL